MPDNPTLVKEAVERALAQLGGTADAKSLCDKLTCPHCGPGLDVAEAQLAMQRATDRGHIIVNDDFTLRLAGSTLLASLPTDDDDTVERALADPDAVHVNMLRGSIAKPSPKQIWHIYGKSLLDEMPDDISAAIHTLIGRE